MKNNLQDGAPLLTNLKVCGFASQETPCFEALLHFEGGTYRVSNEGRGGCNRYDHTLTDATLARLNKWAAQNCPPIPLHNGRTLACDFETWTFEQAFALC